MTATPLALSELQTAVEALGFELVDARVGGPAGRKLVRLRIDVAGGGRPGHGVTTGDCERVSRALETALEGAGAVGPAWQLEVSSPGIERPVRFPAHWRRYVGRDVRLKATGLPGGTVARIVAIPDDEHVTLAHGATSVTLPFEAIREATLVVDWSRYGNTEAGDS